MERAVPQQDRVLDVRGMAIAVVTAQCTAQLMEIREHLAGAQGAIDQFGARLIVSGQCDAPPADGH